MLHIKIKVYIALLFSIIFWGFSFVWSKEALSVYNPITVVFFRLLLSSIFLFSIGILFKILEPVKKEDILRLVLIAFWEPFCYFLGENFGLMYVSPTTAAVIIATIPLFSPFAASIFYKEKINLWNFVGIIFSVVGVFLVVLKSGMQFKINLKGLLLLLWAVFSAVLYTTLVYDITGRYKVYTIIAYQNVFGVLMFLPLFVIFELNGFLRISFSWKPWLSIIELSFFASSIAFILFAYGIKHIGIIKTNVLLNFIPVFTAIFSFFFMHERFQWYNILGIFIVIVGIMLTQIIKSDFKYKDGVGI